MYIRDVGFIESGQLAFQNYFKFSGRAQRAEFWWFQLFIIAVSIIATILDALTFGLIESGYGVLGIIWSLATFIPSLSVSWRRMHDIGKSGLWNLLPFAPVLWIIGTAIVMSQSSEGTGLVIGAAASMGVLAIFACIIYVIVLLATDSNQYDNEYGPSVKYNPSNNTF